MISKKEYYDDFFEVVSKYDDPSILVRSLEKNIKDLKNGAKPLPYYYKEKGEFRKATRNEEISMLKDMLQEFKSRIN